MSEHTPPPEGLPEVIARLDILEAHLLQVVEVLGSQFDVGTRTRNFRQELDRLRRSSTRIDEARVARQGPELPEAAEGPPEEAPQP